VGSTSYDWIDYLICFLRGLRELGERGIYRLEGRENIGRITYSNGGRSGVSILNDPFARAHVSLFPSLFQDVHVFLELVDPILLLAGDLNEDPRCHKLRYQPVRGGEG